MKLIQSAAERCGIPAEALGECRIILSGKNYLSLENHKGLLEYSGDLLRFACPSGIIQVRGRALELAAMDQKSVVVRGEILSVELG